MVKTSAVVHGVLGSLVFLGSALPAWGQSSSAVSEASSATSSAIGAKPPPAAEPLRMPSAAQRAQRYREALAQLKAGDTAAAYDAFLQLWTLQPSYDVAMALGHIELMTERYDGAARHFAYAQQHVPPTDAEKQQEAILRGYTAATQHVRVVHLQVTPGDARIWVDGEEPEGRTGNQVTLYLRAGKYPLRIQRDGYAPHESVYVSSGVATENWPIVLTPLEQGVGVARSAGSNRVSNVQQSDVPLQAGVPLAVDPRSSEPAPTLLMAIAGGAALLAAGGGVTVAVIERDRFEGRPVRASGTGSALLLGSLGLSLATSISWQIWGAVDSAGEGVLARNYLLGSSPGEAPVPKAAVVLSLQAVSAGLAGLAVWKLVQQSERHQALEAASEPGLCADGAAKTESSCGQWLQRRDRVTDLRITGAALLASAGITHLLGLALAEWWPNDAHWSKP